jgi:uncharacterized membrane protein YuzA (DUF378 family)
MTLLSIFWILIGVNFLVLIAIRFGFGKDLMTTIFWILVGANVFQNQIKLQSIPKN